MLQQALQNIDFLAMLDTDPGFNALLKDPAFRSMVARDGDFRALLVGDPDLRGWLRHAGVRGLVSADPGLRAQLRAAQNQDARLALLQQAHRRATAQPPAAGHSNQASGRPEARGLSAESSVNQDHSATFPEDRSPGTQGSGRSHVGTNDPKSQPLAGDRARGDRMLQPSVSSVNRPSGPALRPAQTADDAVVVARGSGPDGGLAAFGSGWPRDVDRHDSQESRRATLSAGASADDGRGFEGLYGDSLAGGTRGGDPRDSVGRIAAPNEMGFDVVMADRTATAPPWSWGSEDASSSNGDGNSASGVTESHREGWVASPQGDDVDMGDADPSARRFDPVAGGREGVVESRFSSPLSSVPSGSDRLAGSSKGVGDDGDTDTSDDQRSELDLLDEPDSDSEHETVAVPGQRQRQPVERTRPARAADAKAAVQPDQHPPVRADADTFVRVPVPRDGWCLLYSVLVSTPAQYWPAELQVTSDAHSQRAAILEELSGSPLAVTPTLRRAAAALRDMVVTWVRGDRPSEQELPHDVARAYHTGSEQSEALEAELDQASDEELIERLTNHGVTEVRERTWLSPQVLRYRYVETRIEELTGRSGEATSEQDARTRAESEAAITDEVFDYLRDHDALPALVELETTGLREAVRTTHAGQDLSLEQYGALLDALDNWEHGSRGWNSSYGEMFPALVAHTLGVRLHLGGASDGHDVGPPTADHAVTVFYNGHDHYDGAIESSLTTPQPTTTTRQHGRGMYTLHGAGSRTGMVGATGGAHMAARSSPSSSPDTVTTLPATRVDTASGPDLDAPVKREPSPLAVQQPLPAMYVHTGLLDQARTGWQLQREGAFNVETNESDWVPVQDDSTQRLLTVHHGMDPIAENDLLFPLRDPDNPLYAVHPHYADETGNVSPNVRVIKVTPFFSPSDVGLADGDPAFTRLLAEVHEELARLINNSRAGASREPTFLSRRTVTRRVTKQDGLPAHEDVLIGQYGLFASTDVPSSEVSGRDGHMLGIYMGALARSKAQERRIEAVQPGYQHYLMEAPTSKSRQATYSGLGATNSVAFANTPLRADKRGYDDRVNAQFLGVRVVMTNNQGQPRTESIVVLIGEPHLQLGQQILVSYGKQYLALFKEAVAAEEASAPVKEEPPT